MNYWMVKQEPEAYSWDDFVKDGKTDWTGVRNFQARNNLKAMKKGDLVFFYHSGEEKAIVGIAEISKEFFPDPKDKEWIAVEITHKKKLKKPVTLSMIKSDKSLGAMYLVRAARLSVQAVKKEEFDTVLQWSEA